MKEILDLILESYQDSRPHFSSTTIGHSGHLLWTWFSRNLKNGRKSKEYSNHASFLGGGNLKSQYVFVKLRVFSDRGSAGTNLFVPVSVCVLELDL